MSENLGFSIALTDFLETIPDLIWPTSIRTYAHMRTDTQITAVLNAYFLPLRQAPKHVDPAGCRDEVVQLIADDLDLPILGEDKEPGPARRRGVNFEDHFRVALLSLVFGHMPFAQAYEIKDGRTRLIELAERMPSTITDILIKDNGDLDGILQFGENTIIPANQLVWYAHEREGAMWQGRSMLRAAYGPWLFKHEMMRVLATSNRRFGMGVPTVEAPPGATDNQLQQATVLASAIRAGDQAGVGLPAGFKLNLAGITGNTPDTLAFIQYLDSQIAQMALASVMNLDSSPNGSRALGDTFINLLLTSLNAIAGEMSTVLTRLAIQMVDYNFGEEENVPRVVIGDVGSRPEVTAEAITGLLSAGAITADPELESWVRERWTLPQREEPPVTSTGTTGMPPVAPEPTPASSSTMPATSTMPPSMAASTGHHRASLPTGMRKLTQIEAASQVDPEKIDKTWSSALDDLVSNWGKFSKAQRQALSDQIQAAVSDDSIDALAQLSVNSEDAAKALAEAMRGMASASAKEMKREATAQGVTISGEKIDDKRLNSTAAAVATIVASGMANAAGREALRVWTPGKNGKEVASMVGDHLDNLSDSFLKEQLGAALSGAQNAGRNAVMQAGPKAKYFASEVLDTNTCTKCKDIDGHEFPDSDTAAEAYAAGGYVECLGRLRCRGIVVAVWND